MPLNCTSGTRQAGEGTATIRMVEAHIKEVPEEAVAPEAEPMEHQFLQHLGRDKAKESEYPSEEYMNLLTDDNAGAED